MPGRDVFRDGTFSGSGRLPGWDVKRDLAMHVYISYLSQTIELLDMVDNHIIKKVYQPACDVLLTKRTDGPTPATVAADILKLYVV